jgi:gamma-glutamyltranspeptidase
MRAGDPVAVLGSMGGTAQPQIITQLVLRLIDGGESIAAAIDAPRWTAGGTELDDNPNAVQLEDGLHDLASHFAAAGYEVELLSHRNEDVGHAQGVTRHEDGSLSAATDPRADGIAIVERLPN